MTKGKHSEGDYEARKKVRRKRKKKVLKFDGSLFKVKTLLYNKSNCELCAFIDSLGSLDIRVLVT